MARLPLVHKRAAESGERGAAAEYLREIAGRLCHDPTQDERHLAAELLERLANDARGLAAVGLAPAKRPRDSSRDYAIWREVGDLVGRGTSVAAARQRIALKHGLSPSRIKAICIAFDRADLD